MNYRLGNRCLSIARTLIPTIRQMRCSHVAFLIKKSKIMHIGWNKVKSHPITLNFSYKSYSHLHAEADVIIKSGNEFLNDFELLVVRFDKNGKLVNSKPCKGCQSLIQQVGLNRVWYSIDSGIVQFI